MAVTAVLTHQETVNTPSANLVSKRYLVAISGTYVTGGFTIAAAHYGAANAFAKIHRAYFEGGSELDANGNLFKVTAKNNTSTTDPQFTVKAYEQVTGGVGYQEFANGGAISSSFYLVIEGVPLGGVIP